MRLPKIRVTTTMIKTATRVIMKKESKKENGPRD